MIQNNNLSVLPFYDNVKYQHDKKSYAYGKIYPLYVPVRILMPFQIIRHTRSNPINQVRLFKNDGSLFLDITAQIIEVGLQIKRFESLGFDIIINIGLLPMSILMPEGVYYLSISDSVQTWFSEKFTAVNNLSKHLKIEWYDSEDVFFEGGAIVYTEPRFKNILYLDSEIGKPEYVFEEEGEKRDGYFFPEKQISEKTYKFTFLAPEYLCDAMRVIRMSDYVKITSEERVYNCDTFLITPKWEIQGDLASVETEFETSTVIKKIGKGYIPQLNGDFNFDFNNDFNIGDNIVDVPIEPNPEISFTNFAASSDVSIIIIINILLIRGYPLTHLVTLSRNRHLLHKPLV